MKSTWLVPFKGRNHSGHFNQNFLWKYDSIYIMDNHRAALWCWLQHLKKTKKYNLFHVDRHYDALSSNINGWVSCLPDLWGIGIQDYLDFKCDYGMGEQYLFDYANYLSIFLSKFGSLIRDAYFATHNEGDKPKHERISNIDVWKLPNYLNSWLSNHGEKWIFNIDLDYFFYDNNDSTKIMFSQNYISDIFNSMAKQYKDGKISVITLALSPEWSGGWSEAERICATFCRSFGLNFSLP